MKRKTKTTKRKENEKGEVKKMNCCYITLNLANRIPKRAFSPAYILQLNIQLKRFAIFKKEEHFNYMAAFIWLKVYNQ